MKRSELTAAAKFRGTCTRCNQSSEVRTAFHVGLWMHAHEEQHRQLDAMATGPLLDQNMRQERLTDDRPSGILDT